MEHTPDPPEFERQAQAYVDGELAADERAEFERAARGRPELLDQVTRLRALKRSLCDAYPIPSAAAGAPAGWRRWRAVAAALLIGIVSGFTGSQIMMPAVGTPPAAIAEGGGEAGMTRVLLHVGNRDPASMAEALLSARYILDDFASSGRPVRVHVVANGPGLDIFRAGVTTLAAQVRNLERDYPNVQFVACQNTIDRLETNTKKPVRLLPQVLRVDSGVADIARKRAGGWIYIGV